MKVSFVSVEQFQSHCGLKWSFWISDFLETTSNDSEEYLSSHFSLYLCHESAARHNSSAGMSQQWVYFCNSINFPIFHKALDFFCSSALSLRNSLKAGSLSKSLSSQIWSSLPSALLYQMFWAFWPIRALSSQSSLKFCCLLLGSFYWQVWPFCLSWDHWSLGLCEFYMFL